VFYLSDNVGHSPPLVRCDLDLERPVLGKTAGSLDNTSSTSHVLKRGIIKRHYKCTCLSLLC